MIDLPKLRLANPGASPEELFNIACAQEKLAYSWCSVEWTARANWLDQFANAPTSFMVH